MKYTATDKTAKEKTKSKNIKTRVIPGYHLSLGIVVTMPLFQAKDGSPV